MPKLFLPRRSDAHRIACLALYRALLKQGGSLSLRISSPEPPSPFAPIQNLIRYRFRRDRRLQSPYQIQDALKRGQTHLELVHNATTGSTPALKALLQTLQSTANHADSIASEREAQRQNMKPPPRKALPKIQHRQNESTKSNHVPGPQSVPLTSLPLPLSALKEPRRQVPYLNEVQGRIAVFRWPGQHRYPVYISRIMRQKLQRFEKMHQRRMDLEADVKMGEYEDLWDENIDEHLHTQQGSTPDASVTEWSSWAAAARNSLTAQDALIKQVETARGERGRFLWNIVKKEQKLSDWETLPEKLVRSAINTRKLDFELVRIAKRRGLDGLADKVWKWQQKRKEVGVKAEAELMAMYWVIPVKWVKNTTATTHTFPQQPPYTPLRGFKTMPLLGRDEQRGPGPPIRFGATVKHRDRAAVDVDDSLPESHPRRQHGVYKPQKRGKRPDVDTRSEASPLRRDRTVLAFRRALDSVKLVDFDNSRGRKKQ